jgi:glycerol-3-phosphate dehydrogenase
MTADEYDVVVIGGGIHGAGVAQAAAAAGHSVLLLERQGIASGTSSRSSKLIHGGLRYLESAQFGLVRESLREREILLRIAPGLVERVPFYIPVYATTRRPPWMIRSGLTLYALLGGLARGTGFESVPRARWDGLDGLDIRGLRTVFRYEDAHTDDAALTQAVMRSAQALGATLHCPADFLAAKRTGAGYRVRYLMGGNEHDCRARTLVNAAGPWVNGVLERIAPRPSSLPVDLVQGAHIILEGATRHGVYYVEAPRDGRAVFVMPWKTHTLVGTTETPYEGDPAAVHAQPEEIL